MRKDGFMMNGFIAIYLGFEANLNLSLEELSMSILVPQ